MHVPVHGVLARYLAFGLVIALTACAGSPGTVRTLEPAAEAVDLGSYDRLIIEVTPRSGVAMMPHETSRLELLLESEIAARDPDRFREILLTSLGELDTEEKAVRSVPALHAEVEITRYDRGDAAQRAFLPGLGQIHLEGVVNLSDWSAGRSLGRYGVEKSFAAGGFYDASTDISDVEYGFGESVADVILGTNESRPHS